MSSQFDMGYIGSSGVPAPGYGLANDNAHAMKIANAALNAAHSAQMIGSGQYVDAPGILQGCIKAKGPHECVSGQTYSKNLGSCCPGA